VTVTRESTATTVRRASADDEGFVRRVFVEASNTGLRASGLPDHQLAPLLAAQYVSRSAQWLAAYSSIEQHILERSGEPVGTCCLAETAAGEVRVVDLAVLPEHQRQGVARDTLREVARLGLRIRLSVWADDLGARALYAGAGFRPDGAPVNGYLELVREPDPKDGRHE
jgi:ribosomal protein S18 acetylase RimI-like enzyme